MNKLPLNQISEKQQMDLEYHGGQLTSRSIFDYDLLSARRTHRSGDTIKYKRKYSKNQQQQQPKTDVQNEEGFVVTKTSHKKDGKLSNKFSLEETQRFKEEMQQLRKEKEQREIEDIERKKRKVQSARYARAKLTIDDSNQTKSTGATPRDESPPTRFVSDQLKDALSVSKRGLEVHPPTVNLRELLQRSGGEHGEEITEEYVPDEDQEITVKATNSKDQEMFGYPRIERSPSFIYTRQKSELKEINVIKKTEMFELNKNKVEQVKKEKQVGHEKLLNWDYQKQLEIEKAKHMKENTMNERDELKIKEAQTLRSLREKIQESRKRRDITRIQKDLTKGFTCKSNMISKQIRTRESEKKKIENQMTISDIVKERKDLNTMRKEHLNELMLHELNRKRAMVTFGNQKMRKILDERRQDEVLQSRMKHHRVKLEKSAFSQYNDLDPTVQNPATTDTNSPMSDTRENHRLSTPSRSEARGESPERSASKLHSLESLSAMDDESLTRLVTAARSPSSPSIQDRDELRKMKEVFRRRTPPSRRQSSDTDRPKMSPLFFSHERTKNVSIQYMSP
jgi:hypothetical protein